MNSPRSFLLAVLKNANTSGRLKALVTASHVENILRVDNDQNFCLRLRPYAGFNSLAFQRVPFDPFNPGGNQLGSMYTTVIEHLDSENKSIKVPEDFVAPRRLNPARKGCAKVWKDYKFPELGDAKSLPNLPPGTSMATDIQERWSSENEVLSSGLVGEAEFGGHPFLSREKASLVDKWVGENVRAGAVGPSSAEPNTALARDSSPGPTPAPAAVPGIKRRVPMVTTANNPSLVNSTALGQSSNVHSHGGQPGSKIHPDPFHPNTVSQGIASPKDSSHIRTPCVESRFNPRIQMSQLVDTSPNVEIAVTPPQNMMFSQTPLIPTRPAQKAFGTVEDHESKAQSVHNPLGHFAKHYVEDGPTGHLDSPSAPALEASFVADVPSPSSHLSRTSDSSVKERMQAISEVDTRKFYKTMRQQAAASTQSKRSTKANQKAKKQAVIVEAWGTPAPAMESSTKRKPSPEPSTWKERELGRLNADEDDHIRNLFMALHPTLCALQKFSGMVSIELQFGLILVHNVPKTYAEKVVDEKSWDRLFRPQHGLRSPGTKFTNMLTSSGADIDYILGLTNKEGQLFFSEEPSVRNISYDFHCQTKSNQSITISVDSSGMTVVTRPETLLGAVNLHCPQHIWDLRAAVKGSQEYSRGVDKGTDSAIESLIDNLYVCPERTRVLLFTRLVNPDVLRVTRILMKRSSRHCIMRVVQTHRSQRIEATELPETECTFPSGQSPYLQITEIQNLLVGQMAGDKSLIRARALEPEEMMDSSRLWYEVAIVSPAIDKVLESNRNLPLGKWQPADLLGTDVGIVANSTLQSSESSRNSEGRVGHGGLGEMYRLASRVIADLDGVGWANSSLPESSAYPPSLAIKSNVTGAGAFGAVGSDLQMGVSAEARQELDNVDSLSAKNAGTGEIFW